MKDLVSDTISVQLPYMRLYLDDIEKIINILKEENPKDVTLKANNKIFEFNEIKELHVEKLKALEITAFFLDYSSLFITFDKYGTRIYCYKNTTQNQGIIKKIENCLSEKHRIFGIIAKSPFMQMLSGLMGGVIVFTFFLVVTRKAFFPAWIHLAFSLLFWLTLYLEFFYKNIIFLEHKGYYKNFFSRNKDQILVGLLVGIPVAIISFFLGRLTK